LDFACLASRLAVEVDGEAHERRDRSERDRRRDAYLRAQGFQILRLSARDVLKNMEGVIITIVGACDTRLPHHPSAAPSGPPPRAGEVQ
jgi:very-short-patch-repair endonuclease